MRIQKSTMGTENQTLDVRQVPLDQITVGSRLRAEITRPTSLIYSIERIGLLHPVVLNSRMELIAGARRLAAVKHLGWKEITAVVAANLDDAVAALHAERDENLCRGPFTVGEMAEAGRRIEELEKPAAAAREK